MLDNTKVDFSLCKHGIDLEYIRKMYSGYYSVDNCPECSKEVEEESESLINALLERQGVKIGPSGA